MAISVLEAASTRLLASPGDLDDEFALVRVAQASSAVERYCGRIFAQQTYRETFPLRRDPTLILRQTPVVAVEQVLIGDTVLDTDEWTLESPESGILTLLVAGITWSATGLTWITVDYTAGYILPDQLDPPEPLGERLPEEISMAVIAWASSMSDQQAQAETGTIRAKTLGLTGDRVEYNVASQASAQTIGRPQIAVDNLAPYRRWKVA